jgi:anion-transporting  ArsA/GET3 family ATPase
MTGKGSTSVFLERKVIICAGPGGVGKTTCAAALALATARLGRKVCVVTVDPSMRLAQALGMAPQDPKRGEARLVWEGSSEQGTSGRLEAVILDRQQVFDSIVTRCAGHASTAQKILENRIYRATSQRLGGALEYAAMARVQMLHAEGRYDLIIVDTPPTANAIDFLEAPQRVRELVDNPASRVLAGTGKLGLRLLDLGGAALLRQLESIAGTTFLSELSAFLREFSAVIAEFQRRGGDFEAILRSRQTGVVLVTTTSGFSIREAVSFLTELSQKGLNVAGVVLNRLDPVVGAMPARSKLELAVTHQLGEALAEPAIELICQAYAGAYAQGQRTLRAQREIRRVAKHAKILAAHRYLEPPQTLDELLVLGNELMHNEVEVDG